MREFMLIFRNVKSEGGASLPEAEMREMMTRWQQWITGLVEKGNFAGTNRLLPEGKVLKPGKAVTDGPYIEAKELVGGYVIVKANSVEEATELAKDCPNLMYGGNVEVRSVMPIVSDPRSEKFLQPVGVEETM